MTAAGCNPSRWMLMSWTWAKKTRTTGESLTTVNCSSSDKPINENKVEIVNTYYKPFSRCGSKTTGGQAGSTLEDEAKADMISSLKEVNSISQPKEIGDSHWRLMENLELMTNPGGVRLCSKAPTKVRLYPSISCLRQRQEKSNGRIKVRTSYQ